MASLLRGSWRRAAIAPRSRRAIPAIRCHAVEFVRSAWTRRGRGGAGFLFGGVGVECAALLVRGGAVWQLVGLITRRSQVQILPPLPLSRQPPSQAAACNTPRCRSAVSVGMSVAYRSKLSRRLPSRTINTTTRGGAIPVFTTNNTWPVAVDGVRTPRAAANVGATSCCCGK